MIHGTRTRILTLFGGLALAGGLLWGCGGGGSSSSAAPGPGGLTNAAFSGTYTIVIIGGNVVGASGFSVYGSIVADGAGSYTPTTGRDDGTTITPLAPGAAQPYSVASDGVVALAGGLTGGITSDGNTVLLSNTSALGTPALAMLIRRSGAYSNATFAGNYHQASMIPGPAIAPTTIWTAPAGAAAVADGFAMVTFSAQMQNAAGVISGSATFNNPYAIDASGVLTTTLSFNTMAGGLTPDGALVVAAGGSDGATPNLSMWIKQGAGMGAAAFTGDYWVVGFFSDPSDAGRFTSFVGSASADGAGNLTYGASAQNYEGAISTPSIPAATYAVAANGALTSGAREGGISADGKYAFLSGENVILSRPTLIFFVRK